MVVSTNPVAFLLNVLEGYINFLSKQHTVVMDVNYRYDSHSGGEREIQRTMLELLNQLDGFDSRGDVKVCVCVILFFLNTVLTCHCNR